MNVTDNHFVSDFFRLNLESSGFEIVAELSFQDREFILDDLSSWINNPIELLSHLPTIRTPDYVIIPGANWDNRISVKVFPDQPVNRFSVVSSVYDIAVRLRMYNPDPSAILMLVFFSIVAIGFVFLPVPMLIWLNRWIDPVPGTDEGVPPVP